MATLSLDKETDFSADIMDRINDSRFDTNRILDLSLYSLDSEIVNENLEDWWVERVTSTEFQIALKFIDPKQVSVGYEWDELIIDINLTEEQNEQNYVTPRTIVRADIPN